MKIVVDLRVCGGLGLTDTQPVLNGREITGDVTTCSFRAVKARATVGLWVGSCEIELESKDSPCEG